MPETGTYSLSGGRRSARKRASSDPTTGAGLARATARRIFLTGTIWLFLPNQQLGSFLVSKDRLT